MRERTIERPGLHVIVEAQVLIVGELVVQADSDLIIGGMSDGDGLKVVVGVGHVGACGINIRARNELQQIDGNRVETSGWNDAPRKKGSIRGAHSREPSRTTRTAVQHGGDGVIANCGGVTSGRRIAWTGATRKKWRLRKITGAFCRGGNVGGIR